VVGSFFSRSQCRPSWLRHTVAPSMPLHSFFILQWSADYWPRLLHAARYVCFPHYDAIPGAADLRACWRATRQRTPRRHFVFSFPTSVPPDAQQPRPSSPPEGLSGAIAGRRSCAGAATLAQQRCSDASQRVLRGRPASFRGISNTLRAMNVFFSEYSFAPFSISMLFHFRPTVRNQKEPERLPPRAARQQGRARRAARKPQKGLHVAFNAAQAAAVR